MNHNVMDAYFDAWGKHARTTDARSSMAYWKTSFLVSVELGDLVSRQDIRTMTYTSSVIRAVDAAL